MEYRKEEKFLVKTSDFEILKCRINGLMKLDSNSKQNSGYNIRSVYFDSYDNKYFYENDAGIDERLKIRIRIYNKEDKLIKLEIKYKRNNLTKKETCSINKDLCLKILQGKQLNINECNNKVLNKLYIEQQIRHLVPKIIVEYDRIAYVDKIGNVRITFDKNIRASKYIDRFFEDNIYAKPILDLGNHVLEVKYDELLPDYIFNCINTNKLEQTTFSKYYISRLRFKEEIL